jgi:hypothetical protein
MSQDKQEFDFGTSGRSASRPWPLCSSGSSSVPKGIEKLYGKKQKRIIVLIRNKMTKNCTAFELYKMRFSIFNNKDAAICRYTIWHCRVALFMESTHDI